eukprot:CAMPEP_0119261510 /NCGR_PEP_ID=MMETSP1329-20130426/1552_1 /TAXON_ID=114041 /ORGANISM="Genus nov. species nov., Strain RCC1024" /LENGTH=386 /DNA_ID=CAMNT_0007261075 /DNA_START=116 /DNA_END=1276 /DNA_ORIENTATION=-
MKLTFAALLVAVTRALVPPSSRSQLARSRLAMSAVEEKANYAIVGCGLPARGMGWFHGLQLVEGECASARLTDVVEPWFLGDGRESPAGEAFAEVVAAWPDVNFAPRLDGGTWAGAPPGPRVALVAGRTADNPGLVREAIGAGATHVLLEKPGAPTVAELEALAADAEAAGVPVFMGFIKNIAGYFVEALACHRANPGSVVTLTSLNDYSEETLAECFERNAEGMLKNMAIHELALAATFFGMTADTVTGVEDVAGDLRTLGGFTDFARLDFTLVNAAGGRLRIVADRCGGDGCSAAVAGADGGPLLARDMVDAARAAAVAARQAEHPEWIGYLVTQEVEYRELKERCAAAALVGAFPEGVASIQVAIEALKLAEYLTPLLAAELA